MATASLVFKLRLLNSSHDLMIGKTSDITRKRTIMPYNLLANVYNVWNIIYVS